MGVELNCRFAAVLIAALGVPGVASAQIELKGTQNVPGRIYYHCNKHLGSVAEAGGALDASMDFAEDGSILRMRVDWYGTINDDPRFGGNRGVTPLYGAKLDGGATLTWPNQGYPQATRLDWDNPDVGLTLYGGRERYDRKLERKEPWWQVLIDRDDRLIVREIEGQRFIFLASQLSLASPLMSGYSSGLRVPLRDLVAWGHGAKVLTVYETRVVRRKFTPNSVPNAPGPNRIVLAYRLDPLPLAETATKVRLAVEQWQGSMGDFRTACPRVEEADESQIIVT
ncbi:MAG: hypothetical protein H2049_02670 [Porphyrobacter sp.]|nr:hypothetical protein [Porphyrobacter sp.]